MALCTDVANGSCSQACEELVSERRWQVTLMSGAVVYSEVAPQQMRFLRIEHVLLCMLQDPEQRFLGLLQMGGGRFVFEAIKSESEPGCGRIGESKEIVYPDDKGCINCQMVRSCEGWKNENAGLLRQMVRQQDLASVNHILRMGQDPNGDQTNPLEAAIQHGVKKTKLEV